MSELSKKLEQLIEQLQDLKKSQDNKERSDKPKKAKKLPPVPAPHINQEDHPPKLSEREAMRLVKEEDKEVCKTLPNGQWVLEKASKLSSDKEIKPDWTKFGHKPVFEMDHVHAVAGMKSHDEAKKFAHDIVDKSSAKDETKKKIKNAIDSSKNVAHLAQTMSNHILSHQGLNVLGAKKR